MDIAKFNMLVDEVVDDIELTLKSKAEQYANQHDTNDRLHNFKAIAALTGLTPLQVAHVLVSKHFVALSDAIHNHRYDTMARMTEEWTGDIINYMILIRALHDETREDDTVQETV